MPLPSQRTADVIDIIGLRSAYAAACARNVELYRSGDPAPGWQSGCRLAERLWVELRRPGADSDRIMCGRLCGLGSPPVQQTRRPPLV